MRAHGKKQRLETLINEEALILAKYLRGEVDMDSKSSAREKIWVARAHIRPS